MANSFVRCPDCGTEFEPDKHQVKKAAIVGGSALAGAAAGAAIGASAGGVAGIASGGTAMIATVPFGAAIGAIGGLGALALSKFGVDYVFGHATCPNPPCGHTFRIA